MDERRSRYELFVPLIGPSKFGRAPSLGRIPYRARREYDRPCRCEIEIPTDYRTTHGRHRRPRVHGNNTVLVRSALFCTSPGFFFSFRSYERDTPVQLNSTVTAITGAAISVRAPGFSRSSFARRNAENRVRNEKRDRPFNVFNNNNRNYNIIYYYYYR